MIATVVYTKNGYDYAETCGEGTGDVVYICLGKSVTSSAVHFSPADVVAICEEKCASSNDLPDPQAEDPIPEERGAYPDPVEGAESRAAPASRPIDLCGLARGPPGGVGRAAWPSHTGLCGAFCFCGYENERN